MKKHVIVIVIVIEIVVEIVVDGDGCLQVVFAVCMGGCAVAVAATDVDCC